MTPGDLVLGPAGLRFRGRTIPCTIGRAGIATNKREGDGATPRGIHVVTATLYRPDRIASPARWARPIRPGDLWSDDPADPAYNRLVRAPHGHGHESLRRADPLYDIVIVTDWNLASPVPGRGSAIFIHQWRRPGFPTAGCIALPRAALHSLAGAVAPGTRLIVP